MIFAAGESSRMGRDKALLDFRGSTFLNHLISLFLPRLHPVIVVLGHHADLIRRSITGDLRFAGAEPRIIVNSEYQSGMLSSFQAGIRALPPSAKAAMFTLVDHPAVRETTLDRLLEEFQASGKPVVIPRYEGRRGHPVLTSRAVLEEMLDLPLESSPKSVIHGHKAETRFLDVDDPGVVKDIDSPFEYEALKTIL